MTISTPTTKEINDNIVAQLESTLNQTIPAAPKSFYRVLARALSGVFILLYKYGGFTFLQMFVRTASASTIEVNGVEVVPLNFWGRLIGVGDPEAATNAELLVEVTVENQTGFLGTNSQLLNSDNGVTYLTLGSVALDAATVQVTVRASSDQTGGDGSGAIGNLSAGDVLTFANPLANVARSAVVVSQTVTGADAEETEVYRQRVIDRFQKRPQGGALADYEIWGEEPAGILNVYPYTSTTCPGQVDVYVEATAASSGSVDGIPTTAQLQEVLDTIELDDNGLASRRPALALVNTFPITRTGLDVQVIGLQVDDEAAVQARITTAIDEYFLEREPFIFGLSVPPRLDRVTRTGVGGAVDDIVSAAGGIFSSLVILDNGTSVELYPLGVGEKVKAASVQFL